MDIKSAITPVLTSTITRTVTVARGRYAPGHLGELTQLLPFEMVDAALTATRRVQARVRDLPSRVVVYLLLAACLFPETGYPYKHEHRHSGIGFHTPASVHYGTAEHVQALRQTTLDQAYAAHPGRFTRRPHPRQLPDRAWINEPQPLEAQPVSM